MTTVSTADTLMTTTTKVTSSPTLKMAYSSSAACPWRAPKRSTLSPAAATPIGWWFHRAGPAALELPSLWSTALTPLAFEIVSVSVHSAKSVRQTKSVWSSGDDYSPCASPRTLFGCLSNAWRSYRFSSLSSPGWGYVLHQRTWSALMQHPSTARWRWEKKNLNKIKLIEHQIKHLPTRSPVKTRRLYAMYAKNTVDMSEMSSTLYWW